VLAICTNIQFAPFYTLVVHSFASTFGKIVCNFDIISEAQPVNMSLFDSEGKVLYEDLVYNFNA